MPTDIQSDMRPAPSSAEELLRFRREMGTISRQSGVFFAGTMFTTAAGYLFKIYVARKLGAEQLGIYALGMTVVALLGMLGALGLPTAAPRFVALYAGTGRFDALRGFLTRSTLLLIGVSLLFAGGAILAAPVVADRFYHTPALAGYMPMFGAMIVTSVLTAFVGQVLAGFKDVARRTVITNFIGTPLMMALAVAMLAAGMQLRGYILAQVVAACITLALLLWAGWKLTPREARGITSHVPRLEPEVLHFSAAVFGVAILEFLLAQTDKILLGLFLDARRVGIYTVAATLVTFVPIVLTTVNQIFSPIISELHARGDRELLGRLFQTLTKWILGLTIPLAVVMIVCAPSLMRLFGKEFEVGWPVLVIGTVGQLVNCAVGSVGFLLLMSGNQRRLIKVQVVMAVATVLLNIALIPVVGLIGAAFVGAGVNVATNLWCLAEVRQALGIFPYNRGYMALILPTLASTGLLMLVQREMGPRFLGPVWIVAVLAASYVVFTAGFLLFGLDADDRFVVSAVWSRVQGVLLRRPEVAA